MNGEPAVSDRVIDPKLRVAVHWIWVLLRIEQRSVLYKFASEVYCRQNKFAVRILNAFVKPFSMEQGGARFNEFAGQNAGNLFAERFVLVLFK